MGKFPFISIIYAYYNTPSEILRSIRSIDKAVRVISYEIIIVDNFSSKRLPKTLRYARSIKLLRNSTNLGYGTALNRGVKKAKGKYLLLVNPDTEFTNKSIESLFSRILRDETIGVIGPQMINQKKVILQSYNSYPFLPDALVVFSFVNKLWPNNYFSKKYWLYNLDITKESEVGFVGGACMMVRKSVFEKVGGFDEQFFLYFEEIDFCYRINSLGYKILYYPNSKIIHLVGRSTRDKFFIRKTFENSRFRFFRKYHGLFFAALGELILRVLNISAKDLMKKIF